MTLLSRLWIYQAERFPLIRNTPLLIVFAAASINVSAILAGRPLPSFWAYVVAAILTIGIFFQMRVADEVKDAEDDARYRPERPIPRGLVSLGLIIRLGVGLVPIMALAAWGWTTGTFALLLLVWFWLALMTFEFGVPKWLKARPVLYLVSHMAIMPLIDLMLTGIEWTAGGAPAPALTLFLALSFLNGCILEIGRKLKAPESEREGVETYSGLWGPETAVSVWAAILIAALITLISLGAAMGATTAVAVAGAAGFTAAFATGLTYRRNPTLTAEKAVDALSGLWVLICYAAAGFLPLWFGATP